MMHLLSFALCLAAFAALALATERQQHDLFGHPLPPAATRLLRIAGTGVMLLALGILLDWQGWGLGLVMFSGHTSLAAGVVFCAAIGLASARRRGKPAAISPASRRV
ncbi:DUF3325 domain-containing protein [Azospirillum sp. 11R-A]|uniref:DUF3325 domain-containing protein n=1 Tax=Azospirillum sp. 11R-A TaxID=3111634 RepID=UPI003C1AE2F8